MINSPREELARRADSKGRLSGFPPGANVLITRESERHYRIDVLEWSLEQYRGELPETAKLYLMKQGLNPDKMLREDANERGYFEIDVDPNGEAIWEYGAMKRTRRAWPSNFDWNEFRALILEGEEK